MKCYICMIMLYSSTFQVILFRVSMRSSYVAFILTLTLPLIYPSYFLPLPSHPTCFLSFLLFYLYYSGEQPRDKEFLVKDWKGKLQTRLARRYRGVFFKICYDAPKSPVSTHTCTIRYDTIRYDTILVGDRYPSW